MRASDFLNESADNDFIKSFLPFVKRELDIADVPTIKVVDTVPGSDGTTFGAFDPDNRVIYIVTKGRHPKDVLRTLAHELVHSCQHNDGKLHDESGETGSPEENEANAKAGIIMRNFNQANPE